METNNQSLNIHQRMLAVMTEVDYLKKGDQAPQKAGGFKYVSHDDVAAALHPQLVKHGIYLRVAVTNWSQDGNRTAVMIEGEFVNVDDPQDRIPVSALGYGCDNRDKGPGMAFSYGYKYLLLKGFCLESGEADNEQATDEHEPGPKVKHVIAKRDQAGGCVICNGDIREGQELAWKEGTDQIAHVECSRGGTPPNDPLRRDVL
jgi:hypothetical protein